MASALKEVNVNTMESKEPTNKKKRMSVERIYQKKTQLEHIILRPDSYIGSDQPTTQNMWVWDDEKKAIVSKSITYTPGLYKIFDEIIVNAADNKQRDQRMNSIKVTINQEANTISVWNNGKGIPVEMHKEEKLFVPSLIFGHLLTSSNYDDTEKKVVGGRNGFGAKLCNIFSKKFSVETACNGKKFKQVWRNNMSKADTEKIVDYTGTDFTCITFSPDLAKFKMESLDDDFVALVKRRAYDMAGVSRGVSVTLNGEKLKVKTFKDYVNLYLKGAQVAKREEDAPMPKVIHEIVNARWEICVTVSETGFQQSSFVNGIATTKGGTHINYVVDQICDKLIAAVKKKTGKGGFNIKPFQVKSHLWVFANCLIENPTFDSQTKENMTLRKNAFGSACELSEKYIKQVQDCGVLENILNWVKFKSEAQLNKKTSGSKQSRLKGIPKLDDANDAGTKHSRDCTLIVTEGDSAKSLAMAGLSVVGRDKYGVFPLKGKLLNVRDASHKQIMDNAEIGSLLKIIGLQFGKKYKSEADMKSLRYGHLMIMADQDIDGSHIKGLVINFIHANWPELLKLDFLEEFITPIVKVTKGNQSQSFFSIPEYDAWKENTANNKSWRIKYYKGLGTSTSKEGKEYFSNMQRHRIVFDYDGPSCDQALVMAFSKKLANDRKDWLNQGMNERKMRREAQLPEVFLYESNTRSISYRDFVNKELILFSNADNERSIPSMVDGFKPGQRKVLFTCMKRNDKHEVKVAQLAGSVAELSAYHHGEMSLMGTIVNLAQNYVGSNNLNLLIPHGQFGSRHMGGKDSASPRYIFTELSSLTRLIFPTHDDHVLNFLNEDNQRIEPEWYCPIIPMCLVNGAEGIGTGYSTKIFNHDVREVVSNVRRMIAGEEPELMQPSYKNFTGEVTQLDGQKYMCSGIISILDENTIEITELPIRTWTQSYKESVLDVMLMGTEKVQPSITDYKEYHTDVSVKFHVIMTAAQLHKAEEEGLYKKFKLEASWSLTNIVLFDEFGCLKKYNNTGQIIKDFYKVRLQKYKERKEFLTGMLQAEANRLENQARFILEKIEGKIVVENRTKRDVITTLVERGFVSDPVKGWKAQVIKDTALDDQSEAPATDYASSMSTTSGGPDFQYLLTMAIMSLSKEKKDELLRQRDEKKTELESLLSKTLEDLWLHDLDAFCEELERVEEQETLDDAASAAIARKAGRGAASRKGKKVAVKSKDIKSFEKKSKEPTKAALKKVKKDFDFDSDSVKSEEIRSASTAAAASTAAVTTTATATADAETADVKPIIEVKEETDEPLSLADRLKKKKKQSMLAFKPAATSKSPTAASKKPAAASKSPTATSKRPAAASKKPAVAAKKKKRNKGSSDEEDDDGSDDDFKIEDFSDTEAKSLPKRDTRKKEVKKYVVESDEDDDDDDEEQSDESFQPDEESFQPDADKNDDNSDESDDDEVVTTKKKRAAPTMNFDDESEDENPEVAETRALIERLTPKKDKAKKPSAAAAKKTAAAAKKDIFAEEAGGSQEPISIEDSPAKPSTSKSKKASAAEKKKESTKPKKTTATAKSKKEDPKQAKLSFSSKAKPTPTKDASDVDSPKAVDSDIEISPVVKKKPTKSSVAVKRKKKSADDSDEEVVAKKKTKTTKAAAKPKPAKKARRKIDDSSDDDNDESFKAEDDVESSPAVAVPARDRGGSRRAATAAKKAYKFSSDEEEDDDDDFC